MTAWAHYCASTAKPEGEVNPLAPPFASRACTRNDQGARPMSAVHLNADQ
jgi:hypothetical protein